jgi:rod shape-determining protein MreC
MENLITRYRNVTILVAVLFAQVLGLAVQVRRTGEHESTRLIRIWAVSAVTPLEKGIVWCQASAANLWHGYFYLRGVRQENRDLKAQIEQLRLQQVRLSEDAEQARRIQALLGFKEQFISRTVAAQVIGSSGSEQSRSIYIDKGSSDGIKPDMAVITAEGVVGKVLQVFRNSSQVLLIDDQTSGVGTILEKSRLQGVLRGTPAGEVVLEKVMSDEAVQPGEKVLTSGGDQIFPKGLPVGTVTKVSPGPQLFLNIRVKPTADLGRLEEVLVITQQERREPEVTETGRVRAADILAQRLPSVPDQPAADPNKPPPPTNGLKILPATSGATKPAVTAAAAGSQAGVASQKAVTNPKPSGSSANEASTATKPAASAPINPGDARKAVRTSTGAENSTGMSAAGVQSGPAQAKQQPAAQTSAPPAPAPTEDKPQ